MLLIFNTISYMFITVIEYSVVIKTFLLPLDSNRLVMLRIQFHRFSSDKKSYLELWILFYVIIYAPQRLTCDSIIIMRNIPKDCDFFIRFYYIASLCRVLFNNCLQHFKSAQRIYWTALISGRMNNSRILWLPNNCVCSNNCASAFDENHQTVYQHFRIPLCGNKLAQLGTAHADRVTAVLRNSQQISLHC